MRPTLFLKPRFTICGLKPARFLKAYGDKELGQDLLQLLESSHIRESNEYGFMLWESGLFVYVMLEHQKKLNELSARLSLVPNGSEPTSTG